MDEYILIFRHENGSKVASPQQIQTWMQQTNDWLSSVKAAGNYVGGNGLQFEDARVVQSNKSITTGPFGKPKETLGGYVIIKAESSEKAAEFAKGSPVLQGEGNTIEVRKLAKGEGVH